MDSLAVEAGPRETTGSGRYSTRLWAQIFVFLFLSAFALFGIMYWAGTPALTRDPWVSVALLTLAGATTLISLARHLPGQNVILAAVLIALSGGTVQVVLIASGSVLGSHASNQVVEPWFWFRKFWQVGLVWIVAILNCRGVVRLAFRSWRLASGYGFWVLGSTAVLGALFLLSFGRWGPVQLGWRTTGSAVGCAIGTVVTLLFVTPSLISKRPVPEQADWHPVVIWVAFNLWFVLAAVGPGK